MDNNDNNCCITNEKINELLLDQNKLLTEASESLTFLLKNLYFFLEELTKTANESNDQDVKNTDEIMKYTKDLRSYVDRVHMEIPVITNALKDSELKLVKYREKMTVLQKELTQNQTELIECEKNNEELTKQAEIQSTFQSAMGAIMGTMLWKSCKTPESVDTFIKTGTLREFLIMCHKTMQSFLEAYADALPPLESYEFKFFMSIFGTIINISAQKHGRDYILENNTGLEFIQEVLININSFQMPAGQILKRMLLMFLYNVSIGKKGAMFIQMSFNGVENILKCLSSENTSDIQTLALTLLTSLLNELPTQEFCQQIILLTSKDDLKYLAENGDPNLQHMTSKFVTKIQQLEAENVSMNN